MKRLRSPKGLPDTYGITRWDKAKIEKDFTLLNFEDYGELPDWVKETLLKLL